VRAGRTAVGVGARLRLVAETSLSRHQRPCILTSSLRRSLSSSPVGVRPSVSCRSRMACRVGSSSVPETSQAKPRLARRACTPLVSAIGSRCPISTMSFFSPSASQTVSLASSESGLASNSSVPSSLVVPSVGGSPSTSALNFLPASGLPASSVRTILISTGGMERSRKTCFSSVRQRHSLGCLSGMTTTSPGASVCASLRRSLSSPFSAWFQIPCQLGNPYWCASLNNVSPGWTTCCLLILSSWTLIRPAGRHDQAVDGLEVALSLLDERRRAVHLQLLAAVG